MLSHNFYTWMLNNVPGIDLQLYPVKTIIIQEQNEKQPHIQGRQALNPFCHSPTYLDSCHAGITRNVVPSEWEKSNWWNNTMQKRRPINYLRRQYLVDNAASFSQLRLDWKYPLTPLNFDDADQLLYLRCPLIVLFHFGNAEAFLSADQLSDAIGSVSFFS